MELVFGDNAAQPLTGGHRIRMPLVFAMFAGLLFKHFLADYVFQPKWMLSAKGRLDAPGGYAHAGLHALGSGIVLIACGIGAATVAAIMVGEAVVHYAIDYAKDRITLRTDTKHNPKRYWLLHGLDQFAHQMTYVAIAWIAFAHLPA